MIPPTLQGNVWKTYPIFIGVSVFKNMLLLMDISHKSSLNCLYLLFPLDISDTKIMSMLFTGSRYRGLNFIKINGEGDRKLIM